jgi:hypothetical protein
MARRWPVALRNARVDVVGESKGFVQVSGDDFRRQPIRTNTS